MYVYYVDQIFDMIVVIFVKFKFVRLNSIFGFLQGEKVDGIFGLLVNVFVDEQYIDFFFVFIVVKIVVLRVIKFILLVVNLRSKMSGNVGFFRNYVFVFIWDGI